MKVRRIPVVLDLYSKRKKKAKMAGKTEPYKYDDIPKEFRVQAIYIWRKTLNQIYNHNTREFFHFFEYTNSEEFICSFWRDLHSHLAEEYGKFSLSNQYNPFKNLKDFFLNTSTSIEELLDVIELTFQLMTLTVKRYCNNNKSIQILNDAIKKLNIRFEEHSIGYELNDFQIIRKDSKFIHKEIVKKSLELLHEVGFQGASDEFLSGHSHYRKGKYKEAINDALKSFESTMKTICKKKGWNYEDTSGAKKLIKTMFDNKLIHSSMKSHFNSLINTLEGLPTIRNKVSAHGQGEAITDVPRSLAQYALNLAATNIVFLVESYKDYDSPKVNPKHYS